MTKEFVFGLDFGTSKTALTWTKTGTGNVNEEVTNVPIDQDGKGRTATCLLKYPNGDIFIGSRAEEQFKMDRLAGSELFANFKPHIHQNDESRKIAGEFLKKFAQHKLVKQNIDLWGDRYVLVAGCPVAWTDVGKKTLISLLKDAGFKNAYTVAEPIGAAFNFLGRLLTATDFHRDIVIIDWGAGTFDMSAMRAGRIKERASWGSTVYGGRLFDDLFFQWMWDVVAADGRVKENLDQALAHADYRTYLQEILAREIKEHFSNALAQERPPEKYVYPQRMSVGSGEDWLDLGSFRVAGDWRGEFERRARSYKASPQAQDWITKSKGEIREDERQIVEAFLRGHPVDLLEWGNLLLNAGLAWLNPSVAPLAILTGGSTKWGWFGQLVRKHPVFQSHSVSVLLDSEPELTIARGLSRVYAIGTYTVGLHRKVTEVAGRLFSALNLDVYPKNVTALANQLAENLRGDPDFPMSVLQIFQEAISKRPEPPGAGASLGDWTGWAANALRGEWFDQDAVTRQLDARRQRLLDMPAQQNLLKAAAKEFGHAAFAETMQLLKTHADKDIDKLVSVLEACNVAGEHELAEQIQSLAGKTQLGPGLAKELWRVVGDILRGLVGTGLGAQQRQEQLNSQVLKIQQKFFQRLPAEIEGSIRSRLPPAEWAHKVVEHVVGTLGTIIEMSGVENSASSSGQLQLK